MILIEKEKRSYILLAGFLKRDWFKVLAVTFSKISQVFFFFFWQLLVNSFSIIFIIILIIIILIIIHLNSYLVSLLYDTFNYYLSFYYYLSIYFSFLLFISHFIFIFAAFFYIYFLFWPFLCLNFVLPISPTVLYCFKCYPNWPQILREERQGGPKKKKVQVANYFVFAVVSLQFYGFS